METIKLDLIPGKKMPSLHASQFDDGREHGIDLFENGVVYKLDGTETLTINERKGDDCICSLDIVNTFAETNHIVFASTEQMCAVWGNNLCELVIKRGSVTLGTLNFILEIEPSPTEGGIESESEIKNLERQIEAITEEVIGDNYYTAEETDEAIADATEGKADKTYVDTELVKKADKNNTYTKSEVDTLIDNLPEPMIFKGTLGVGGTIQTLPAASASNEGWTYKVITDGTYAGQTAKVGDVFTSNGSDWVLIPSGDEDNDTWRAIKVEGVEVLGNGISSGAVDFVGSENIEVDFDGNGNKVGVKTKNIYTKTEVDDIVYNILPDDTASGSVANFETDLALPLKSLKIDVNAKQDLHGYDYPWPAGGGKNLIDVEDTSVSINNAYYASVALGFAPVADKTYTISVEVNTTVTPFNISVGCGSTSYATDIATKSNLDNGRIDITFTPTAEQLTNKPYIFLRVPRYRTQQTATATLKKFMLEEGSSATEYAPYENICPITGHDSAQLFKTGKNLLSPTLYKGLSYNPTVGTTVTLTESPKQLTDNHDGTFSISTTANWETFCMIVPIKSTTYYRKTAISSNGALGTSEVWLDKNLKVISTYNNTDTTQTKNGLLTIPSNASYFAWVITNRAVANATLTITHPQLEVGSVATEYEPYNGNTEVIELGGTYYGGHFTQDKDGHRQFVVANKLFTFSGNENWQASTNFFYLTAGTLDDVPIQANVVTSNGLTVNPMTNRQVRLYPGYGINSQFISMSSTVEELQGYLTNGISFKYALATPIIIDLSDGEPINTINGTNNIYADTGDTSVVFKNSVNGYVEKKIANVQALTLNT